MKFSTSVLLGLLLASSNEVFCSKLSDYLIFDSQRPPVDPKISENLRDSYSKFAGNAAIQAKQKRVEELIPKFDSNDSEIHLNDSENTQNGNPSIIQTIPRSLQVVHILDKLDKEQAPRSHEGTISMFRPDSVISKFMKQAKENESQSNTEKGSEVVVAEANATTASSDKTPEEVAKDKARSELIKSLNENEFALMARNKLKSKKEKKEKKESETDPDKHDEEVTKSTNSNNLKNDSKIAEPSREIPKPPTGIPIVEGSAASATTMHSEDESKSKFPWKAFLLSAGGLALVAAIVSAVYIATQTIEDEESVDL